MTSSRNYDVTNEYGSIYLAFLIIMLAYGERLDWERFQRRKMTNYNQEQQLCSAYTTSKQNRDTRIIWS